MAGSVPNVKPPDPGNDKLYIVSNSYLRKLKKEVEGLVNLELGPGLKLTKGDSVWRVELDLVSEEGGQSGSGSFSIKAVTICENDSPVTYNFLVQL